MAGYSGKPLVQKLGLKPSHRVALVDAPEGFERELEPLPGGVRLVRTGRHPLDCVVLFGRDAATLHEQFVRWARRLTPAGMLWAAWPKRASKIPTDVAEATVRKIGIAAGMVDVKVCAVNDVWSGLKFVRRLADRGAMKTRASS